MQKKITKREIFELLIIFIFMICSLYVCLHHEYWSDEAHAWLLARDCTIKELLTIYLHSDGHPALWHLIIKLFQTLGLQYEDFFVISIFFSTLGVSIFVIYSKFPMFIKALLPFTYFIFFQYTTIVRGYCLLFFILSLLATMYDNRHEKTFLYTIIMILLLSTESYAFIFAGMLYIIYIYEFLKEKQTYSSKQKKNNIICIVTLFICFILTILYVYPYKTNTFNPFQNHMGINYILSYSFLVAYKDILLNIPLIITNIICTIFIIALILLAYKNNITKGIRSLFTTFPVILFLALGYANAWHVGIIFLIFIFLVWIHHMEKNKYILILLSISIVIQLYWTLSSTIYEINNPYSGAAAAASLIKEYNYEELSIFGEEFYASALNPYFDHNLYENWDEKGFFYWDLRNKYYDIKEDFVSYLQNSDYDIIVISPENKFEQYNQLIDKYNIYEFTGNTYIETNTYENQSYQILVNKKIDRGKI